MGRILRRRIALAVALVAILAGGTAVALGATREGHHRARHARAHRGAAARRSGLLDAASSYLGVPKSRLQLELQSGKSLAEIAKATPGKSEAGLVAALVAAVKTKLPSPPPDLETRIQALVNRTPATERDRHFRHDGARRSVLRATVLSYLGLTRRQLVEQLKTGKTIAQVADSIPGKSAAGLTDAIVKAFSVRLDAAVAAHRLSKDAEAQHLARLHARISRVLDHTHPGLHHPQPQARSSTGTVPAAPTG
jgi:hypothetical protein